MRVAEFPPPLNCCLDRNKERPFKCRGGAEGVGGGHWLDKNTTINLHPSRDQCLNAFLIGFDGVWESAQWHWALAPPALAPPALAPPALAPPWIHTSWSIDFRLVKHCSRAQAPRRPQISHYPRPRFTTGDQLTGGGGVGGVENADYRTDTAFQNVRKFEPIK